VCVSARAFAWDAALLATLRHCSLPFGAELQATPLADVGELGGRDRLSLLGQLAAHEALLQFAGVADGELDPAEWMVVQKRGSDVRLVRVAARACDASTAPPPLTIAQQFAEAIGAQLDILGHSWARADAVYADAFARVARDVTADVRWLRASACGAIASPLPDGLHTLSDGRFVYEDAQCIESLERFAQLDASLRVLVLRGASPLERYSALGPLLRDRDRALAPPAVAERIIAATSDARHVFVVADDDAFDAGSREVVELLAHARHGTWLVEEAANSHIATSRDVDGGSQARPSAHARHATSRIADRGASHDHGTDTPDARNTIEQSTTTTHPTTSIIPNLAAPRLPAARPFVVAPRLAAAEALVASCRDLDAFVQSDAFGAYLAHGDVPPAAASLPALAEPARSYIGALALLGDDVPRDVATRFLGDFLFRGALEELVVDGVTSIRNDVFTFVSTSTRAEAARRIPPASRPSICRAAAAHASGVQAALLWLDAGDAERAAAVLEETSWPTAAATVEALRRVPQSLLTPPLARRYAHALIDCGRYRDAREVAQGDELVLASVERHTGDYATALARLERMPSRGFDAELLRAEILRLLDREADARAALASCAPSTDEERIRLTYERALHGDGDAPPPEHYLAARLATYRALERGDYDAAFVNAAESHRRARNVIERVDASLDRLFAKFSAGAWDEARAVAIEALQEVEETQGDRAAGGILFTLAYLAADAGQWAHASQRIARLRRYYGTTHDALRLAEIDLLTAHLDFTRGRFADARRAAQAVFERRGQHDQIEEAAALILDELDWLERRATKLRSAGRSGNAELSRRRARLAANAADESDPFFTFRKAIRDGAVDHARELAQQHGLHFEPAPAPVELELRVLRNAAIRDFPYEPHDFEPRWCFATRNRLGQWNAIGSQPFQQNDSPDWIECSERELLFVEGSARWSAEGRDAVAAIFRTRAENHRLRRVLDQDEQAQSPRAETVDGIVGQSAPMRELFSLVTRIARRDVAVCILGESGTGKELVARAIHRHSPRRPRPFTAVNCAALPENLIESELFGHVRGAFTGADRDRAGLIETTDGGTLFLDEIGELPLTAQAKLLRFLQEGEFRRVGEAASRSADVRIVSATNRKLEAAVEEGRFRDDLYYRIRGVELALPPLRERGHDVLLLARHFLAAERDKHRNGAALFSVDVEAIFTAYPWPGNVRELQNTVRAAHAMAGEAKEIEVEHLPERLRRVAPARLAAGSYAEAVTRFKRDLIEQSLLHANGNQNRAANALQMSRQALAYQIRELGIMVRRDDG
jgi:DNA-binding NtrC family response regulator